MGSGMFAPISYTLRMALVANYLLIY